MDNNEDKAESSKRGNPKNRAYPVPFAKIMSQFLTYDKLLKLFNSVRNAKK